MNLKFRIVGPVISLRVLKFVEFSLPGEGVDMIWLGNFDLGLLSAKKVNNEGSFCRRRRSAASFVSLSPFGVSNERFCGAACVSPPPPPPPPPPSLQSI